MRKQIRADGIYCANARYAGKLIPALLGESADTIHLFQHALCLCHDLLADPCKRDLLFTALEQQNIESVLELFDGDTQRRLTDITGFHRPTKMALPCQRNDIT